MSEIVEAVQLPLPALPEVERARAFIQASRAPATLRAYDSDWRLFTAWCAARDLSPLPALAGTVALFLSGEASAGTKAATIGRRAAAIRYMHKMQRLQSPTHDPEVQAAMAGIRRTIGTRAAQKAPATADLLIAMLNQCSDTLKGKRDRALLSLGFSGAFRRSELVALQVQDLEETERGLRVVIRQSKSDQEGRGQEIAILRGAKLCAIENLQTWMAAAGITSGPIFRRVNKADRVMAGGLAAESVADLVKQYALKAALNPEVYAGHSLRAGFLTSAAEAGADVFRMMDVSRHKRVETVRGYVRRADAFKNHAGETFL